MNIGLDGVIEPFSFKKELTPKRRYSEENEVSLGRGLDPHTNRGSRFLKRLTEKDVSEGDVSLIDLDDSSNQLFNGGYHQIVPKATRSVTR